MSKPSVWPYDERIVCAVETLEDERSRGGVVRLCDMLPVVAGRFNVCSDETVRAWVAEYATPTTAADVLGELEGRSS